MEQSATGPVPCAPGKATPDSPAAADEELAGNQEDAATRLAPATTNFGLTSWHFFLKIFIINSFSFFSYPVTVEFIIDS